MNSEYPKWLLSISKRFQSATNITLFALVSVLILYTILYQFIPFADYYSGLILAAILTIVIGYPLGKLIAIFNSEIKRQNFLSIQDNEVKSHLISILGHDIRGPLNNIKKILELVHTAHLSKKEFNTISHQLISDADNTLVLTNNLINWIKIQKTGFSPNIIQMELSSIVNETIELYESTIREKSIDIKIDYPHVNKAYCDAEMCKIIFRNILSNSIKYSNEGSEISIKFHLENERLSVAIADNGIGMSQEMADKLMQEEIIPSQLGTNQEKGAGIGLTITKKMIEQLGGKIWLKSIPSQGTTFFIELPQKLMSA